MKDTPILYGEDANKFLADIKANENKRISQSELKRIEGNYKLMKSLEK